MSVHLPFQRSTTFTRSSRNSFYFQVLRLTYCRQIFFPTFFGSDFWFLWFDSFVPLMNDSVCISFDFFSIWWESVGVINVWSDVVIRYNHLGERVFVLFFCRNDSVLTAYVFLALSFELDHHISEVALSSHFTRLRLIIWLGEFL